MKDINLDSGYTQINPEMAKKIIDNDERKIILDVRTLEEYECGHIEGAILMPYDEVYIRAEAELLNKDEIILVYCRSGVRSVLASRDLAELGYSKVYEFGGIIDWPYDIVK